MMLQSTGIWKIGGSRVVGKVKIIGSLCNILRFTFFRSQVEINLVQIKGRNQGQSENYLKI